MPPLRSASRALLPFALHAVARALDARLGLLLHTSLDVPDLALRALALAGPTALARAALAGAAVGALAWAGAALARHRLGGGPLAAALEREAPLFDPLLLRPALTLLALAAVALRPTFPYAATLPVALTQDWGIAQDLAALAALVALRGLPRSLPAPGAGSLFLLALLGYGLAVPEWGRNVEGHPGNEPKYLRMAVSLGQALQLDVEGFDEPMEELVPRPFAESAGGAARVLARESLALAAFLAGDPPSALRPEAIEASRLARQTIRGKRGGVYHVLAPGPSLLLAVPLRVDRWLNLRLGTPGRLRTSLLLWNALAAALVAALFLLARDACGRPGIAAAVAAAAAALPPFVFYSFEFYPEMPGALVLALALRALFLTRRPTAAAWAGLGALLAALPWLHQKFLPVWMLLAAVALWRAVEQLVPLRSLLALLVPQLASLAATALYNFAITGSPRPDALFRAWGPGGVSTATLGQGSFGLLLDIHYGLLPYAPVYLLALGGLALPGRDARPLRRALPAVAVYYLTVAAADDWHGAVSNLGRYAMPALPWVVALVALALARLGRRPGVRAVALALATWSGLTAWALWSDPHAANDASLLAARSEYADVGVYVPDLFIPSLARAAPGLPAQLLAWGLVATLLAAWLARGRGGSPRAALVGLIAAPLLLGTALESWPSPHRLPRFRDAVELQPGSVAFVTAGGAVADGERIRAAGDLELLVRSRRPLARIVAWAAGDGAVRAPGSAPVTLGGGRWLELPLEPLVHLSGRRGVEESLYRARLERTGGGRYDLRLRLEVGDLP